jgi:hypothetical protein
VQPYHSNVYDHNLCAPSVHLPLLCASSRLRFSAPSYQLAKLSSASLPATGPFSSDDSWVEASQDSTRKRVNSILAVIHALQIVRDNKNKVQSSLNLTS